MTDTKQPSSSLVASTRTSRACQSTSSSTTTTTTTLVYLLTRSIIQQFCRLGSKNLILLWFLVASITCLEARTTHLGLLTVVEHGTQGSARSFMASRRTLSVTSSSSSRLVVAFGRHQVDSFGGRHLIRRAIAPKGHHYGTTWRDYCCCRPTTAWQNRHRMMTTSSSSIFDGDRSDQQQQQQQHRHLEHVPVEDDPYDYVVTNLEHVRSRILTAAEQAGVRQPDSIRLVAVSKTKPIAMLQTAYNHAQCNIFGENYVQELIDKVPHLPNDVEWHFIGPLQSNKVSKLLVPFTETHSLHRLILETVGSIKLATKLNRAVLDYRGAVTVTATTESSSSTTTTTTKQAENSVLNVFVQVNTSGEDSKSGVAPVVDVSNRKQQQQQGNSKHEEEDVVSLCRHIVTACPGLHLVGLMTIGAPTDSINSFVCLRQCRASVQTFWKDECWSKEDGVDSPDTLELSMGMSDDFEAAIRQGATNVRVGSTIFGARNYPKSS